MIRSLVRMHIDSSHAAVRAPLGAIEWKQRYCATIALSRTPRSVTMSASDLRSAVAQDASMNAATKPRMAFIRCPLQASRLRSMAARTVRGIVRAREAAARPASLAAARFRVPRESAPVCDYLLPLLTQFFYPQRHHIAGLEPHRLGFLAHADTGGRAGGDDVSRHERHVVTAIRHELLHPEDHRARIAALHPFAVHVEPHFQTLRIRDFVARDEPRPQRPEGIAALALVPLRGLELEGALRDVVGEAVAG